MQTLTPKQKQILDFLTIYFEKHGYSPSLEEISKRFEKSVPTIFQHIETLKTKGFLLKTDNISRGIQLNTVQDEVMLLGKIAAGEPIEPIEIPEPISIPSGMIRGHGNYYALQVKGASMIDEGIFDGDTVIIRHQNTVNSGETVVAITENGATLKKIVFERGKPKLIPANQNYLPFFPKGLEIRGRVIGVIRKIDYSKTENTIEEKHIRRMDYSWDYKSQNVKTYTHGIHNYPAMFIPQVAKRLLETYSKEGETVCDIFCGSGTALVESRLLGRNAYGIDLNPLAIFLAKAKTTPIDPSKLIKEYTHLLSTIGTSKDKDITIPKFKNIDFWFKEGVIYELAKIKHTVLTIKDPNVRNYFLSAFSETVRLVSNTKNGEFKLVRIRADKLSDFNPNVLNIFKKRVEINIKGMTDFYKDAHRNVWTKLIHGDSSKNNGINKNSIDYIITSPPYGDSRTTVAYGQFSRFSAQWIDIFENPDNASSIDNELLGGKTMTNLTHYLKSDYLKDSLSLIAERDEKRARDVLSFFIGLNECFKKAYELLKPKKYFCVVIGNRMVKQIRIPTDYIVAELCEDLGFKCKDIFVRNIPGKRMPSKNSPTNIAGELEETMVKESIIILKKN